MSHCVMGSIVHDWKYRRLKECPLGVITTESALVFVMRPVQYVTIPGEIKNKHEIKLALSILGTLSV